jgi:hypothetical protein
MHKINFQEAIMNVKKVALHVVVIIIAVVMFSGTGFAAKKPNILVIWGDDIGWSNISKYNHGMMGYKTPNIDRIADEGAMFTDWYAQQAEPHLYLVSILSEPDS